MRLTKFTHACVRLEQDGRTLVIDPGGFTEPEAAVGAEAILLTHQHEDHVSGPNLQAALGANPDLEIWTNPAAAEQLADLGARVHTVTHGDTFEAAGFDVHVYGEKHAVIHRDLPSVTNVGFHIGGKVFYPGDAFTVPEEPVDTLLTPTGGPWLKIGESIDYFTEVKPRQAISTHDAVWSPQALGFVDFLLSAFSKSLEGGARRLPTGDTIEL
jgi:L-ascorbate metabolism protein UlaG (beta-lactamase superfamily)